MLYLTISLVVSFLKNELKIQIRQTKMFLIHLFYCSLLTYVQVWVSDPPNVLTLPSF